MPKIAYRLALGLLVLLSLAAPVVVYKPVMGAEVTQRSIGLSSSARSVTTRHRVAFNFISSSSVGSIEVQYCSDSPIVGTPCTAPTGLNASGTTLLSESGATGFSVHANTTSNRIVLTRTASAVTPGAAAYLFDNIVNPSSTGTYYTRIGTFASTDGTGSQVDYGGLAFSINDPVQVGAYVPPVLLFCVGTSISGNSCSGASGDTIDFGVLSKDATSYGSVQMLGATNGFGGYSVSLSGTTMTSGVNTISALATSGQSQINTSQFGLNLRDNSEPDVGLEKSGNGFASVQAGYNTPNFYRFNNGDVIISANRTSDVDKFTASYIVNISEDQKPGVYSTTMTYIELASF